MGVGMGVGRQWIVVDAEVIVVHAAAVWRRG